MKSKLNIKSILIVAIIGIFSLVFFNQSFAANTAKVNVDVANIRKAANANSDILEQISKDQEVEILEKTGDWYKIKYNNIQGYLRKDLLNVNEEVATENAKVENTVVESNTNVTEPNTEVTSTANATAETNTTATEKKANKNDVAGMYTCKENIKLKIIPLILGNDIKEINKDATVNVLEINNKWALVESGTNRGWVLVNQIEKVNNQEPAVVEQEEKVEEKKETEENVDAEKVEENKEEEKKEEVSEQPVQEEAKTEPVVEKTMYVNGEVVNVRKEESTTSDSIAQLRKATQVTVVSENNGWSKVKFNNQEGFIASTLLTDTKPEVVTSRSLEQPRQELPATETQDNQTTTPKTSTPAKKTTSTETPATQTSSSSKGQEVCSYARQYLGCKYVYGGTSPKGFDCSGFTQYVFKHFGVTLNRTAEAQASNGTYVSKSNLKAGDLLIFTHHAGIYLGNGTFIHAANSTKGVITTSLSDSYYVKNYITARRIFN